MDGWMDGWSWEAGAWMGWALPLGRVWLGVVNGENLQQYLREGGKWVIHDFVKVRVCWGLGLGLEM